MREKIYKVTEYINLYLLKIVEYVFLNLKQFITEMAYGELKSQSFDRNRFKYRVYKLICNDTITVNAWESVDYANRYDVFLIQIMTLIWTN